MDGTTTDIETITINDVIGILSQQDGRCALSGLPIDDNNLSIDHIVPIGAGGSHTKENAQILDKSINMMKGQFKQEDFIKFCKLIAKANK